MERSAGNHGKAVLQYLIVKNSSKVIPVGKDISLARKVSSSRIYEVDARQSILSEKAPILSEVKKSLKKTANEDFCIYSSTNSLALTEIEAQ